MDKRFFEEPEFFISDEAIDSVEFDPAQRSRRKGRASAQKKAKKTQRAAIDWRPFKRVVNTIVLLTLMGGAGYGAWFVQRHHKEWCPIREVRIEGTFVYLERDEFARQIESVAQGGFFDVDLEGIKEAAAMLPWVDSIVIRRLWPDRLVIQVTEKRALARWQEDALISDRGELFYPKEAAHFPAGLVVLKGASGSERKVYKALQQFEARAKTVPMRISEVGVDARGGWWVTWGDGIQLTLGKELVFERFERFVRSYSQIQAISQAPIESVDMRYRNGFAVAFQTVDDRVGL